MASVDLRCQTAASRRRCSARLPAAADRCFSHQFWFQQAAEQVDGKIQQQQPESQQAVALKSEITAQGIRIKPMPMTGSRSSREVSRATGKSWEPPAAIDRRKAQRRSLPLKSGRLLPCKIGWKRESASSHRQANAARAEAGGAETGSHAGSPAR